MRGGQRDAQRAALGIAGQHHDDERRAGLFREIFGVAGEVHTSRVDHALVYGRRRHRREFAGLATRQGAIENGQHVRAVRGIKLSGNGWHGERDVEHGERIGRFRTVDRLAGAIIEKFDRQPELGRALGEQALVAENHDIGCAGVAGQAQADFRSDPGRFAAGDGDQRPHYCSCNRFST